MLRWQTRTVLDDVYVLTSSFQPMSDCIRLTITCHIAPSIAPLAWWFAHRHGPWPNTTPGSTSRCRCLDSSLPWRYALAVAAGDGMNALHQPWCLLVVRTTHAYCTVLILSQSSFGILVTIHSIIHRPFCASCSSVGNCEYFHGCYCFRRGCDGGGARAHRPKFAWD